MTFHRPMNGPSIVCYLKEGGPEQEAPTRDVDFCVVAHHIAGAEVDVVDKYDAIRAEALPRDGRAAVGATLAPQRLEREVAHLGQKLYPVLTRRPCQAPCTTLNYLYRISGPYGLGTTSSTSWHTCTACCLEACSKR